MRHWTLWAMFLVLLGAELFLQISSGVYHAERGVYADEAVHFTNGVLIRDYVRTGIGQSPLRFAEEFYLSFPKIAPFMWPPLLHIALGSVMLLPIPAQTVALLLIAFVTAGTAFRASQMVANSYGTWAGLSVGLVYLGLQCVQDSSTAVMADSLVALMAIEAVRYLAKYWESRALRDAQLFGVFTGLACFTKGNGLTAILMVGVLLIVSWQWSFLLDKGLYWAAGIVVVLAGPWMALSWYLYATNSAFHPVDMARIARFTREYWAMFSTQPGWAWTAFILVGVAATLISNRKPLWLTVFSLWFATVLFHVTTSQSLGTEERYVLLGFAPFLMLAPAGADWLIRRSGLAAGRENLVLSVAMGVLALVFFSTVFSTLRRPPMGYAAAAKMLRGRIVPDELILIASDASGEGAFVAEFAAMEPKPKVNILRATKIIADQDWMGNNFQMRYDSPGQAMDDFEKMKLTYFLVDETPEFQGLPCVNMARRIAKYGANRLERVATFGPAMHFSRTIAVYRLTSPAAGPRKPFQVNMQYSLGRPLAR